MRRWLALLALCSCGRTMALPGAPAPRDGATPAECQPVSGSRLRARFLGGGGAEVFQGWFDRQRNEPCSFRPATDGSMRCLPPALPVREWYVRYLDPDCRQPAAILAESSACGALGPYVTVQPWPDCGDDAPAAILPVGDILWGLPLFYRTTGGCAPDTFPMPMRRLGLPLPPAGFVAGTPSPGPAGRITTPALAGSDGSLQPCGGPEQERVDRARDESCLPFATAGGTQRCLPARAVRAPLSFGYHADSGCHTPVASSPAGCADPSLYVRHDDGGPDCFLEDQRVASVTPLIPFAGPVFGRNDFGACNSTASALPGKLWTVGPKLADDDFAAARLVELPAGGRLRPTMWEWEGGHRQWSGQFNDAARGEPCRPRRATDGKLRCLPGEERQLAEAFIDATCTTRGPFVELDSCSADRSALLPIPGVCPSVLRVFPLERVPGTVIHAKYGADCVPLPRAPSEAGLLGSQLHPSELVELTERVE